MTKPVVVAVLAALAGARAGDRVAVVGAGPLMTAALLAGAGGDAPVEEDADVVVAGAPYDVPQAIALLAPGGRLVALAADGGAAARVAAAAGLQLRHVERLGRGVAWSAVRPAAPEDERGRLDG